MRSVRVLWLALWPAACGGLPPILPVPAEPAAEAMQRCTAVYPTPDFRVVHSIAATLPGDQGGTFIGVTATADGGRSLRSMLLSLEGLALVDATWSEAAGVAVARALPPLDQEGFAQGMVDDIRLLLFPPPGVPVATGRYEEGGTVCRWRGVDDGAVDVVVEQTGGWRVRVWDAAGDLLRDVAAGSEFRDGFSTKLRLTAPGAAGYVLELELLEVEPGPAGGALPAPEP